MSTKKRIYVPILLLACLILLLACFGSKNKVYTSLPNRTIPLDSVKTIVGALKLKPEVDSFLVNFRVPGDSSCPVKIEFLTSQHKLERLVTDSVYSPGFHQILWGRVDANGGTIDYYRTYYYKFTICGSTHTKGFFYRKELY
ncbi:MAG: hypothetical protein GY865_05235 [candidate division Zixibacteria bacterium]|nr:hypothetical protein [candidate division Zixibacteria bacterium]